MAIGAISSLLDNLIKLWMARQRPTADLLQILTPAPGYSYPSGHAVYFTWTSFMIAFVVAPRIRPSLRWIVGAHLGRVVLRLYDAHLEQAGGL